jgi:hypothetical protein
MPTMSSTTPVTPTTPATPPRLDTLSDAHAYRQSLARLVGIDDQYSRMETAFREFDPAKPPFVGTRSENLIAGEILLFDLTSSGLRQSLFETTDVNGWPIDKNSITLAEAVVNAPQPRGCTARMFVHIYYQPPVEGIHSPSNEQKKRGTPSPYGLNLYVLAVLGQRLGVNPDLLLLHFQADARVVPLDRSLPSHRQVLSLSTDDCVCTIQVCNQSRLSQEPSIGKPQIAFVFHCTLQPPYQLLFS